MKFGESDSQAVFHTNPPVSKSRHAMLANDRTPCEIDDKNASAIVTNRERTILNTR